MPTSDYIYIKYKENIIGIKNSKPPKIININITNKSDIYDMFKDKKFIKKLLLFYDNKLLIENNDVYSTYMEKFIKTLEEILKELDIIKDK